VIAAFMKRMWSVEESATASVTASVTASATANVTASVIASVKEMRRLGRGRRSAGVAAAKLTATVDETIVVVATKRREVDANVDHRWTTTMIVLVARVEAESAIVQTKDDRGPVALPPDRVQETDLVAVAGDLQIRTKAGAVAMRLEDPRGKDSSAIVLQTVKRLMNTVALAEGHLRTPKKTGRREEETSGARMEGGKVDRQAEEAIAAAE